LVFGIAEEAGFRSTEGVPGRITIEGETHTQEKELEVMLLVGDYHCHTRKVPWRKKKYAMDERVQKGSNWRTWRKMEKMCLF